MIRSVSKLEGYSLQASDGDIGHVRDFYFDDRSWAMRYLVIETGSWLTGRRVLISPKVISGVDWGARQISVSLTCDQIEHSPDVDTAKPVSRQQESALSQYYGYTWFYGLDPTGMAPIMPLMESAPPAGAEAKADEYDPHLRSANEVRGYHIQAQDGDIGHIEDFLSDDDGWKVGRLIVATSNWWPGKTVMIAPRWIMSIDWNNRTVALNLTREQIQQSPEFNSLMVVE
jgi:hypothetical protein